MLCGNWRRTMPSPDIQVLGGNSQVRWRTDRTDFAMFQWKPVSLVQETNMDLLIVIIVLLLLFGGGGGLYWGMGSGWGIGPIGLIIAVLVIAFLLNARRGRRL
jgi:hypothetical protein